MNAKRQTIWLVSMLSLMVVLSAYYLFTEDVSQLDMTSTGSHENDIKVTTKDTTQSKATEQNLAGAVDTKAAGSTGAQTTDEEVLKKLGMQAASGADYFVSLQMKRNDDLSKQTESLMAIANDKKKSNEEVTKAMEQLDQIETMQSKITNVEDLLGKDYKNVIVTQENGKYRVSVQADKLEKSEAVTIADLVIKELGVSPDKVEIKSVK